MLAGEGPEPMKPCPGSGLAGGAALIYRWPLGMDVGIQRSKKVKRGLLEWEIFIVFNINTNVCKERN